MEMQTGMDVKLFLQRSIFCHLPHSGITSDPEATILTLTLNLDLLNLKSAGFNTVSRTTGTTVPSFKSLPS